MTRRSPSPMMEDRVQEDEHGEELGAVPKVEDIDFKIVSEVETEEFSFEWALSRSLYEEIWKTVYEHRSPLFYGGPSSNHAWRLVVNRDNIEYMSVFLLLANFGEGEDDSDTRAVQARLGISLLDKNGRPFNEFGNLNMDDVESNLFLKHSGWRFQQFLPADEVYGVLVGDSLKFRCTVQIEGRVIHEMFSGIDLHRRAYEMEEDDTHEALVMVNDFGRFYKDYESKDITFSMRDGTVKAHKQMLMARSPVFARMFTNGTKESTSQVVKIIDFDLEIVTGMLEWIYCGKTGILFKRTPWLLQIAEKYFLPGLKLECECILVENIDVQNVMRLLLLGDLYNSPFLKKHAVAFLNRNKAEVQLMPDFSEMVESFIYAGLFVELFLGDCQ